MSIIFDQKPGSEHASSDNNEKKVDEFKERMLQWSNPVEFVNNMYSCHPGDEFTDYFYEVFGRRAFP